MPETNIDDLFTGDTGDAGTGSPVPVSDSAPAAADSGLQPIGDGAGDGQPKDFPHWEQIIAGDPALSAKAQALVADYTRKMQELAEQRRQFEGVDPAAISAAQTLQQLHAQDPALAAAWLEQQAQALRQVYQVGQVAEADPFGEFVPETQNEQFLLAQVRQMFGQLGQFDQWRQQQEAQYQQQQVAARVNDEFGRLERETGRTLTPQDRERVVQFCLQNNLGSVYHGFRAMQYDAAVKRAEQNGLNRGAAVTTQKVANGAAPAALAARTATGAPGERLGLKAHIAAAFDEAGTE